MCVFLTKPKFRVWNIWQDLKGKWHFYRLYQLVFLPLRLNDIPNAQRSCLLCVGTRVAAAVSRREASRSARPVGRAKCPEA